jgi:glycosyltransferase involved in cell wall biosynthesis
MDKISVIIPVFNVDTFLSRCINSVLSQTHDNIEVILVNDGSTDTSQNICEYYSARNPNIVKILRQENKGPSAARNSGLELATGDYIAFVDGDDFINQDYLFLLHNSIIKSESDISICGYLNYNGHFENGYNFCNAINCSPEDFFKCILNHQTLTSVWGKLYRKSLLDGYSFIEDRIMEDMFFWPYILKKTKNISLVDKPLYYYNRLGTSITRSSFNLKKLDMVDALVEWNQLCIREYPDLLDESIALYYRTIFSFCEELYFDKSNISRSHYLNYRNILFNNAFMIYKNKYIANSIRIKLILLCLGLAPLFFQLNQIRRSFYALK